MMRIAGRKLAGTMLPAVYWLAVTFSPLLHDHSHHLGHAQRDAGEPHACGHGHHQHGHHHHGHAHGHSQPGQHHHAPGSPLHDDDCSACRFLALKTAPVKTVGVVALGSAKPQAVLEIWPAAVCVALPLPLSRGPPRLV